MEINAVAHLDYWTGESISGGSERLNLIVKFKEPKKLLKRKLECTLVSTWRMRNDDTAWYNNKDDYYEEVNHWLDDPFSIKEVAEKMVKNHFEKLNKNNNHKREQDNVLDKVNKIGKIEVKVEIK